MRKKIGITLKIVTLTLVASMILCAILFFIGFVQFERQFERQYRKNILSVAHTARAVLNADLFSDYLNTKKPDGSWYAVHDVLQKMVNQFDLNLIYVSCVEPPEYNRIHYIYNPVRPGSYLKEYPLGYSEEYKHKSYNDAARLIFTEGTEIIRRSTNTWTGTHITANVPVRNSMGAIVAMLGVQISTQEFTDAKRTYIHWTLEAEGFFILAYVIFLIIYFRRQFIKPILAITQEAQRFASDSSSSSNILDTVKNRDEIGTLAQSVQKMEQDILSYIKNITQITSEKERMNTELNIATSIQAGLLIADPVRTEDVSVMASMTPAKEVGGDFYDYSVLDDDHVVIIVADVSGKGVPAALFMAMGTTLLRDHVALVRHENISFSTEINVVNNVLCRHNEGGLFITAWIGILNTKTGRLTYMDAGHNPPLLIHNGKVDYIPKGRKGIPLAAMEDFQYKKNEIYLDRGDRLILYTDGVTEAQDTEGQLYGEDRFKKYAEEHKEEQQEQFIKTLLGELSSFQKEQFDDITVLILDYKKG